jgi:hypothetical protein
VTGVQTCALPICLEVLATYPDWAERNERLLEQLNDVLKQTVGAQDARSNPESLRRGEDYVS